MRYRLRMLLMALLVLCFAGCGKQENTNDATDNVTISNGTFTVGCHVGYPPMEYEEGDVITGFDIELAQAIADEMGMELEIVPCAWDAIFINLEGKSYDAIISSVSYTDERAEKYALTNRYLDNRMVIIVPADSDISGVADLEGKCVGVQLDTTADYEMQQFVSKGSNIEIAQYEGVSNAFDALQKGSIDGICADNVVVDYMAELSGIEYKIVWKQEESQPLCICLLNDNEALLTEVNSALDSLVQSGKLAELSEKYFGEDLTK